MPVDLVCAARALAHVPFHARSSEAQALLMEADTADWHRRASGQLHPRFGDGTLAAAARKRGMGEERSFCDVEFAAAAVTVLQLIILRASAQQSKT